MENASKALLIAGGVLIALLIITLLIFTVTKLGDNQRAQSSGTKASQLAAFNRDFERYTEGTINGTDIISIINKINDYNQKQNQILSDSRALDSTYINYSESIKLTVTNLNAFNSKYTNDEISVALFSSDTYTYSSSDRSNTLKKELENFQLAENDVSFSTLKQLSAIYNPKKGKSDNEKEIRAAASGKYEDGTKARFNLSDSSFSDYKNGKYDNGNKSLSLSTIAKYKQYSEFKSSKFVSSSDYPKYYTDGQIQELRFEFKE